ncbi:3-hydroxyacyl-ACP dehydratase [Vibrio furnissii]|uniref:3-hydroxyacyl-ACP dehydratase n=2 Tax=Vibrionaceae TaxID=641 RepID=A0A0Q2XZV3_VIBFU|nr:3-hydroxymyristoyl/3-hydroxydecanoyl-(acyl carrier protein) dehydratase [Vibrio furnissii NCTC 11218]KQH85876.1 3-hydroxyacyl-ACP dehydratase [Vibrio furnissii]TRN26048.1 3-hydroxyacyl-ACP dehydratase [Vibrio furnissii]
MMTKRKPTLLATDIHPSQATLSLRVDADILDFSGHFPNFALLPGVTQIDWAIFYANQYLATPTQFKGMEVIKFQEPILPDMTVALVLNWDADKQKLAFQYRSERDGNPVVHASGKMKLGERSD